MMLRLVLVAPGWDAQQIRNGRKNIMSKSTDALESKIKHLELEVNHLSRLFYFETASTIGLQRYTLARISELTEADQEKEMAKIFAFAQQAYDSLISGVEDVAPARAAAIDIRGMLAQPGRDQWYFPSEPK
jgi:hypothetical protein